MSKDKRITELEAKLNARRVENDALRQEVHNTREAHKEKMLSMEQECAEYRMAISDLERRIKEMESPLADESPEDGSDDGLCTRHYPSVEGEAA